MKRPDRRGDPTLLKAITHGRNCWPRDGAGAVAAFEKLRAMDLAPRCQNLRNSKQDKTNEMDALRQFETRRMLWVLGWPLARSAQR